MAGDTPRAVIAFPCSFFWCLLSLSTPPPNDHDQSGKLHFLYCASFVARARCLDDAVVRVPTQRASRINKKRGGKEGNKTFRLPRPRPLTNPSEERK